MVWRQAWGARSMRLAPLVAAALGCSREAAPSAEIKDPQLSLVPVDDGAASGPKPRARDASPVHETARPATPPADLRPAASDGGAPPSAATVALTELAPTQGDLVPLLQDQVARARKRQLRPVVEFYADWCGPCRAFQASLGDAAMIEALRGTFLIKLNIDDWKDKLDGTGYDMKSIPFFFLVGADGRPSGKVLDGDKWGRSTVANMSAALHAFLAP